MAELKKIWQWLSEIDSHGIYDSAQLKKEFTEETGLEAPKWPEYTDSETVQAIKNRGLGGNVVRTKKMLCYGYSISAHLAHQYAGFYSNKLGRGFAHRDCIEALRKAEI